MKKILIILTLMASALLAYVAAGPYLTLQAMGRAIEARDSSALARHVDFPALQASLRAQVEDAIARRIGPSRQDSLLEGLGLQVANALAGGSVQALATPAGLAALMQGREVWDRLGELSGADAPSTPPMTDRDVDINDRPIGDGNVDDDRARTSTSASAKNSTDPLANAEHRFESTSRFVAVVKDSKGRPITLVLTRHGLTWKLSDIRLQP